MCRNGKIARLPNAIREELNVRLENQEQGPPLLNWLNGLPVVKRMLQKSFGGVPVSKQNLSEWRQGGFREWQALQEARELIEGMASESNALQPVSLKPLTDKLAPWLVARYFMKIKAVLAAGGGPDELKLLHEFCGDLVALRRSDHSAMRLTLAQAEPKEEEGDLTEGEILDYFQKWLTNPEVREWFNDQTLTPERRDEEFRKIFGLADDYPLFNNRAGKETGAGASNEDEKE